MAIILHNENLKIEIETPGEKYRGSRFDWNGTVTKIWYKGKQLLSQEKKLFHRDPKIYGRGLHNEFGIKNVVGYDDIPVGEYFPKIGTGWLKKDEKPYFFFTQYKLDVLDFSWQKISDSKAVFFCDSGIRNGYGYRYTKTFELKDDGFTVSYNLENSGEKKIETTEYIHNFLLPCGKNVSPALELAFNWEYDKANLQENVKTEGLIDFTANGVKFLKVPDVEYFLGGVWEARKNKDFSENGKWVLKDSASGITMQEEDSFVPYHSDVWGHNKCVSPELFKWVEVEPGKTTEWTRTYSFKTESTELNDESLNQVVGGSEGPGYENLCQYLKNKGFWNLNINVSIGELLKSNTFESGKEYVYLNGMDKFSVFFKDNNGKLIETKVGADVLLNKLKRYYGK